MNDFVIVVNKEKGMTSFDVVRKLKKIYNTQKIGHTGTLDPNATGVLVCAVGEGTKLIPYLESDKKTYECEILLGIETDTFDIWGTKEIEEQFSCCIEDIDSCLNSFKGKYFQTPTMYSANKVNGVKLYEYKRRGIDVEIEKKEVEIFDISWDKNVEIFDKHISFKFEATVSKGTYIRSLCHDIGLRLGTHGTMKSLNRIKAGNYSIIDSFTLDDIESGKGLKKSLVDSVPFIKVELIDEKLLHKVSNGMPFYLADMKKIVPELVEYVSFVKDNELVAIYKKTDNSYKADRVWKL